MIERILNFSVTQRFFVVLLVAALAAFGVRSLQQLPIDAVPDITNNQVQINTEAPALSPFEIEKHVTFPIETALAGIPGLEYTRSLSRNGFSPGDGGLQRQGRYLFRARSRSSNADRRPSRPSAGRRAEDGRGLDRARRSLHVDRRVSASRRQGRADRRRQAWLAKRWELSDA